MQEMQVRSLGQEEPLEKEMATHSRILAWRFPMDRGAWWATVHGVEKSRTRPKGLSMHSGTSVMVQWLRIRPATRGIQIPSLVGELRSHEPQSNEAHAPQLESLGAIAQDPAGSNQDHMQPNKYCFKRHY